MQAGAAEVTPIGMVISGELSLAEWAEIGKKIGRASTAFQLAVGDWLVYGEDRWKGQGELGFVGDGTAGTDRTDSAFYDYACQLTGIDRQVIKNYAYVSRNVGSSLRHDDLSYQHYVVLAKLPVPEQVEWVGLATGHGQRVPTRQLAKSIEYSLKGGERRIWSKEEIVKEAMADKPAFIDAPEPMLDRFIRSMERQDFSQWTPEMKGFLWRRFDEAARLMIAMGGRPRA